MHCQQIPDPLMKKMLSTFADRLRFPSCFGRGAIRIFPNLLPVFVVPLCLVLASFNFISTLISFAVLFTLFSVSFRLWTQQYNKKKMSYFFIWGLISFAMMFGTIEWFFYSMNMFFSLENFLILIGTGIISVGLKHIKKDPGIITMDKTLTGNKGLQYKYSESNRPSTIELNMSNLNETPKGTDYRNHSCKLIELADVNA